MSETDYPLQDVAREVSEAIAEGRAMWDLEHFDWPWFIGPHIDGCDCDVKYHDERNITMGLRLTCPRHGDLARAMLDAYDPTWRSD